MDPTPKPPGSGIEQRERINLRILYAEDEEEIREVLGRLLQARYSRVEIVENGQLLMDKLLAPGAAYDCVLSDDGMKKKKGTQALQEIRAMENLKTLPFILLTALPDLLVKEEVERLGGVYLNKPISKDELYAAIEGAVKSEK